jgi:hypothetical protein
VVKFNYRLTGTGWAEATLVDVAGTATVPASYLVDTLGVLLGAVAALLSGATDARCSWELEPGEYRWLFTRAGTSARLRVLRFDDAYPPEPDELGVVVFETIALLADMAAAFADGAQAVLDEHGAAGYIDRWVEHPFPVAELDSIRARLAS